MLRIVSFDVKIENRDFYLGTAWRVLTPLIRIAVFWLVFGLGIRGGAPVDGFPFLVWLLAGLIPWFFINSAISQGASSIRAKAGLILKVKYPISTVPVASVIKSIYEHGIMLVIMAAVFLVHGIRPSLHWLNLVYYMVFSFVFLVSLTMVFSVLVMLAQDLANLINSLLNMLFFLTPILWTDDGLPGGVRRILALNPVRYIVVGFRDSLLYKSDFFMDIQSILFFWAQALCLLLAGCWMQKKYSRRFIDWM